MQKPENSKNSTPQYLNLGYMNGWPMNENGHIIPKIVQLCEEQGHQKTSEHDGFRCVSKYWCPICKYIFRCDSSD